MLKYFFDRPETESKKLFEGTILQQTEEKVMEMRGKFHVIFISFKDIKQHSWAEMKSRLSILFSDLFTAHINLLEENLLHEHEKAIFNQILTLNAQIPLLENALKMLCNFLNRKHKQQVVLLINEYDTPIHTGFTNGFYDEIIVFMRGLFGSVLKDNPSLFKACITGILRVSKESLFSGLNNVSVYTTLSVYYAEYFGFTEDEVKKMTDCYELSDSFNLIRKWYDGYKIGDLDDIYNPWSITNYIVRRAEGCLPYWANTASDELLRKEFSRADAEKVRSEIALLSRG